MCTVVLDFYSDTCNPCKRLAVDLEEISKSFDFRIEKINIMEQYDLTEKYNIRSVPTLVFLKDQINKATYIGYKGKEDLYKFIQENS